MENININEIMTSIPEHFNPSKAEGVTATVQCIFTGEQASDWVIEIKDQTCSVREGKVEKPDLTLKADAEVGTNVLMGKTDPMKAFLFGKIKVVGDIAFGMKLAKLFS